MNKKYLLISAATEHNESIVNIVEASSLIDFVDEILEIEEIKDEDISKIKATLETSEICHYPDEIEPEIDIAFGQSPLGTEMLQIKVWKDDVLERYNQTYIELPKGVVRNDE